jgi:serine/threonine protein kinase
MQLSKTTEPIPGYFLKERIGFGGYGEVWSAQAPGDLAKAIKFVYGHFDDARAARELKALQRIREVRHPFLLSLERFEIIDGQLLIVTELADMSLKDRYEQAKNSGTENIPRDELLGYLRDAADALDYMSENFSLQHLDVKPENLLLVGGRVKVADFGLVKELHDVTGSLMGGLTPVYASPELFDGRPTQRSDQYSLAIVYQEMLTAALPFPGRTAAQLTSQHLHASPRLTALPAKDQPIIARALSKDPAKRFPNCRALIDALLAADQWIGGQPGSADARPAPRVSPQRDTTATRSRATPTDVDWQSSSLGPQPTAGPSSRTANTQVIDARGAPAGAPEQSPVAEALEVVVPPAAPIEPVVDLPPLEPTATETELRPTLVLGIGGTGGHTLRQLRRRVRDRFGSSTSIPSLQMLLLDTDAKSLYQATQGDRDTALCDAETLPLPLRNARDYTTNSGNILQWLSRRWLYNIPRSLQTEGRRPLGRLALVDHAQQVYERIRKALVEITSAVAIEASAAGTGLKFSAGAPRVLVVASISGGTGGGMVLDVAHLVRKALSDLGLPDNDLCGLLTHSTDRNPSTNDLALANAYACLSELHHYNGPSYYPGDPACGLTSAEPGEHTFSHVYFVNLGHNLSDDQFEYATDDLASYLYLNSVTGASAAFDQCRQSTPTAAVMTLRTFGLACVGSSHTSLPALATQLLLKEVLDRWCRVGRQVETKAAPQSLIEMATQGDAAPSLPTRSTADQTAADHARQTGLELEPLRQHVVKLVEKELGGDPEAVLDKLRARIIQRQATSTPGRSGYLTRMLHAIGSLFGASSDESGKQAPNSLPLAMEQNLKELAAPLGAAVRTWILGLIECPGSRIGVAWQAKEWYANHLRSLETTIGESLAEVQQNIQAAEHMLWSMEQAPRSRRRVFRSREATKPTAEKDGALLNVIRLRSKETVLHGLCKLLRLVVAQVSAAGDQLKDLQRELGRLSQGLVDASGWNSLQGEAASRDAIDSVRTTLAEKLCGRLPELAQRVDEQFQTQFLEGQGGLRTACQHAQNLHATLLPALRAAARTEIMRALKEESIVDLVLGADGQSEARVARLGACVDAAKPGLTDCGGSRRLLAVLPPSAIGSAMQEVLTTELTPPPTILNDSDADLVLCYEVQELAIPYVAAFLIGDRGDVVQIANRLHTRCDVTWSKLPDVTKCSNTTSTAI